MRYVYLLLAAYSVFSMEKADTKIGRQLDQLKPFAQGRISVVPRYLYENYTQYVCASWPDEKFERLKAASKTAEAKKLLEFLKAMKQHSPEMQKHMTGFTDLST